MYVFVCVPLMQALSPDDYRRVMKIVEDAILSTDLAMYFDKYKKFADYVENGEFDWQNEDKKECKSLSSLQNFSAVFLPVSLPLSVNRSRYKRERKIDEETRKKIEKERKREREGGEKEHNIVSHFFHTFPSLC